MGDRTHSFKRIFAAFALTVGISLPAVAWADDARMQELYDRLAEADAEAAALIVTDIRAEWSKSGSAAVDLLLRRGRDAMDAGDWQAAIEHYTAAIDHAPDFAEAYNGRAAAYYLTERVGPALDDIRQVLVLEPRHFEAMQGFAILLEEMGLEDEALEVYRQVQVIYPADSNVIFAVERLEKMLEGQTL